MARQLSIKQKLFIDNYLVCKNGFNAARLAGYKGTNEVLYAIASENLRKPQIRNEIDNRLKRLALSADEVLAGISFIANGNIAEVVDLNDPILQKAAENGTSRLIKAISLDKDTGRVTRIELYSAHEAMRDIGKHRGLFPQAIKLTVDEADKAIDDAILTHNLPAGTIDATEQNT